LGLLGDRTAISHRDGSFEITGAEAGNARLQAFQREFAWGGSEPLELVAGKVCEGVLVKMHTGGGIEGNVTDRHGRPLAQAIVAAFSPGAFGGGGSASSGGLYQGETDGKGDYTIQHVTAGSYFVVVTRGDAELNPLSFFGTLNFDLVSVPEDDMVRYDLVDSSAGGCRVHGRVSDQGVPVTRGMLAAMRFDGDSVLGFEMKAAPLDAQGRFEFAGLAPGDYQLNLDGQGGQIRMNLEVPDVPELELELELPHGGIEGVVLDDATNEPVAGAEVLLNSTEKPAQGGGGLLGGLMGRENRSQRRSSDERGRFQFERLRTAEYEIVVRSPREKELRGRYAPSAPRRIQVDERRTERNVELRLAAALTLKGVVKDAAGLPVKDVSVVATPEGGAAAGAQRQRARVRRVREEGRGTAARRWPRERARHRAAEGRARARAHRRQRRPARRGRVRAARAEERTHGRRRRRAAHPQQPLPGRWEFGRRRPARAGTLHARRVPARGAARPVQDRQGPGQGRGRARGTGAAGRAALIPRAG
jgi:protocatechuate 3,4-dioxygenase beta subunit